MSEEKTSVEDIIEEDIALTEEHRTEIKKLALTHIELLWIIIEELLEESGKSDEILRSALRQWSQ